MKFLLTLIALSAPLCSSFLGKISTLKGLQFDSTVQRPIFDYARPRALAPRRLKPLHDILGFGPAEIAITLVVALVLFGPETLKSLSKDVGKAAAELKEIPKTFKEGMEEGAQSSQVSKMKALAAEKRKKRDEKLAASKKEDDDDDDDDDDEDEDK